MEKILELQQRLSRKDKNKFLDAVEDKLSEIGYEFERKKSGSIIKSVNLETKSYRPEYVFMAHYDTPTIMPTWLLWLMKLFGQNNQILIAILLIILIQLISMLIVIHFAFALINLIVFLSFIPLLFANKKNFDDNTSGVIALLSLAEKCKKNGVENVKFVFVDNEELGLFGSRAHKRYLEKEKLISPDCKVISLDCVGAGDFPLIICNSKSNYAKPFFDALQKEFKDTKSIRILMPLSDNFSFTKYGAINISFMNKAIMPTGYYIPNVHSSKDDKIDLEKIEKLTDVLANIVNENAGR